MKEHSHRLSRVTAAVSICYYLVTQTQCRDDHANVGHGGANRFILYSERRSMGTDHHQVAASVRSLKQRNERYEERDSNIAVDLTETIKEETVNHQQSFIDQTCV